MRIPGTENGLISEEIFKEIDIAFKMTSTNQELSAWTLKDARNNFRLVTGQEWKASLIPEATPFQTNAKVEDWIAKDTTLERALLTEKIASLKTASLATNAAVYDRRIQETENLKAKASVSNAESDARRSYESAISTLKNQASLLQIRTDEYAPQRTRVPGCPAAIRARDDLPERQERESDRRPHGPKKPSCGAEELLQVDRLLSERNGRKSFRNLTMRRSSLVFAFILAVLAVSAESWDAIYAARLDASATYLESKLALKSAEVAYDRYLKPYLPTVTLSTSSGTALSLGGDGFTAGVLTPSLTLENILGADLSLKAPLKASSSGGLSLGNPSLSLTRDLFVETGADRLDAEATVRVPAA